MTDHRTEHAQGNGAAHDDEKRLDPRSIDWLHVGAEITRAIAAVHLTRYAPFGWVEDLAVIDRRVTHWVCRDGVRCVNCGHVLTEHRQQIHCPDAIDRQLIAGRKD